MLDFPHTIYRFIIPKEYSVLHQHALESENIQKPLSYKGPFDLKFEFFPHVWKINKKCEILTPFANFSHQILQKVWKISKRC